MGVMLVDVPPVSSDHDLAYHSLLGVAGVSAFAITLYLMITFFVASRLETFQEPLQRISVGDFSTRVPTKNHIPWELKSLAHAFNEMASKLAFRNSRAEKTSRLRQKIILEERERIARELHDGMAQILTFINLKASAVRLMLHNDNSKNAEQDLLQLESAAQDLLVDLRMVILGLRGTSQIQPGLKGALVDFTEKFSNLSKIHVDLDVDPNLRHCSLDSETELQLFRIIQEALINTYKHASAQYAWIKIKGKNDSIHIEIGDDGIGFQMENSVDKKWAHFGLSMMKERAESIGAHYQLKSSRGNGTTIHMSVSCPEDFPNEDYGS